MSKGRIASRARLRCLAVAALCFGLASSVAQAEDASPRTTMRLAVRSAVKLEQPRPTAQLVSRPLYSASAYTCTPSGFGRTARCVQRGG